MAMFVLDNPIVSVWKRLLKDHVMSRKKSANAGEKILTNIVGSKKFKPGTGRGSY